MPETTHPCPPEPNMSPDGEFARSLRDSLRKARAALTHAQDGDEEFAAAALGGRLDYLLGKAAEHGVTAPDLPLPGPDWIPSPAAERRAGRAGTGYGGER